jgi:restriction endonuclease EcoRII-like protein
MACIQSAGQVASAQSLVCLSPARDRDVSASCSHKQLALFPGSKEYHDRQFDSALLVMLGAKSTLKERWRQILTEAEKIPRKHLCTLEPAISKSQTDDIANHAIQLVIPEAFHQTYTDEQKPQLWTVSKFVEFVQQKQRQ